MYNSQHAHGANPSERHEGAIPFQALPNPYGRAQYDTPLNTAEPTQTSFLIPPVQHRPAFAGPPRMKSPSNSTLNSMSRSAKDTLPGEFSISSNISSYNTNLHAEFDDNLHKPDPKDMGGSLFTARGLQNLGCLSILCIGLLGLFAGYPLYSHFTKVPQSFASGFNYGGINGTGQVPRITGDRGLIDVDTPKSVFSKLSSVNGKELQLVFSDEFTTEGRSFYPGDDPYWEAVDLHYWQTNNLEWYSPSAVTTRGGALEITLTQQPNHGLEFMGGLLSSWNKLCFSGMIETAVVLPGSPNVAGLWPAIWTMGNLGRAGYGASLEGTWPYSYDSCDVGTAPNQTMNGLPMAATKDGDPAQDGVLSFLPGQKLSRCTCPEDTSHPGPKHDDGTWVGRSAPEIDIFEAQVRDIGKVAIGQVSQSSQWAPFNAGYLWPNTSENLIIPDLKLTALNSYIGGAFQQSISSTTNTDPNCYELGPTATGCFSVYGFEYQAGFDDAYITWFSDNKVSWTLKESGLAADTAVEISSRPIPQEPMYIIANLGASLNFGDVDLKHLVFPTTMRVDWIRVYQPKGAVNVGCDPKNFPTMDYIDRNIEAYTNPNLTTWVDDYKKPFPASSFRGECR